MGQRGNKYHAVRVACDQGGTPHAHDSKRERARCFVLHHRQAAGEIRGLLIHQPRYVLTVNGREVGHFTPDFHYFELGQQLPVVEDVKAPPTRRSEAYRLRRKVFEACWAPLTITEVE